MAVALHACVCVYLQIQFYDCLTMPINAISSGNVHVCVIVSLITCALAPFIVNDDDGAGMPWDAVLSLVTFSMRFENIHRGTMYCVIPNPPRWQ